MAKGAGNFADVWKHCVLLELVESLVETEAFNREKFSYFETHGSLEKYNVNIKTYKETSYFEANRGITRIIMNRDKLEWDNEVWQHPYLLLQMKQIDDKSKKLLYKSSWSLVLELLNKFEVDFDMQIREKLNQNKHIELNERYRDHMNLKYICDSDGYDDLDIMLKENYKPDLVFIDPYYKNQNLGQELRGIIHSLNAKQIQFVIWAPKYSKGNVVTQLTRLELNSIMLINSNKSKATGMTQNKTNVLTESHIFYSKNLSQHMKRVDDKLAFLRNNALGWS